MKHTKRIFLTLLFAVPLMSSAGVIADNLASATHKVYVGHCDRGDVRITVYKLKNDDRIEEYAMTHRESNGVVPKMYTLESPNAIYPEPKARFFIVKSIEGGEGKTIEREFDGATIYKDLKRTAPNLYNMIRNTTGFGLSEKGNIERNAGGVTYATDCVLNNKDVTGPFDPITK